MEKINNDQLLNKKIILNSLKIFLKSLILCVLIFFYIISIMFFISPKIDAKIFSFFKLEKAEEACYLEIYERSKSNADLYNLILFESELENYEKELYYLNVLLDDDEYVEFYQKLDNSAISTVKDKSLIAYTCNTNAYLVHQKVRCMYYLGFDTGAAVSIKNFIRLNLQNDNLFESSFSTYVDLVYNNKNLTNEQKSDRIENIYSAVDVLLTERLNKLIDYSNGADLSIHNKIIAQNAIVNIRKANYMIDKLNNDDESVSKTLYEEAVDKYNVLVV